MQYVFTQLFACGDFAKLHIHLIFYFQRGETSPNVPSLLLQPVTPGVTSSPQWDAPSELPPRKWQGQHQSQHQQLEYEERPRQQLVHQQQLQQRPLDLNQQQQYSPDSSMLMPAETLLIKTEKDSSSAVVSEHPHPFLASTQLGYFSSSSSTSRVFSPPGSFRQQHEAEMKPDWRSNSETSSSYSLANDNRPEINCYASTNPNRSDINCYEASVNQNHSELVPYAAANQNYAVGMRAAGNGENLGMVRHPNLDSDSTVQDCSAKKIRIQ